MKKLVLTLVLGVFAFGSSGFVTHQFQDDPNQDCLNDAWDYGTFVSNNTIYVKPGMTKEQVAFYAMQYYIDENC